MENIDSFPLAWPTSWPRTNADERRDGVFKPKPFDYTRRHLMQELERFEAEEIILSTNLPLRKDGMPYASARTGGGDPGVAVYFKLNKEPMVLACDTFTKIEFNLHAISLTVEALRGIQRWGSSQLLKRAFSGFTALPPPAPARKKRHWTEVFGVIRHASLDLIKSRRNGLLKEAHPDYGGTEEDTVEILEAYAEAEREKLGTS